MSLVRIQQGQLIGSIVVIGKTTVSNTEVVGSSPTVPVMKNTYDLFKGEELIIAELIQQRRLQLLVHSCIYYELNHNIVSDKKWDEWARELRTLQEHYPDISKNVMWYDAFKDWDASTGAFLPIKDEWVVKKARQLTSAPSKPKLKKSPTKKIVKKRLF